MTNDATAPLAPALPGAWQALLDAMPDAVWLVDPRDLRIAAANARAGRFLGTSTGRPIGELFASPEDACFWAEVAAGLDDAIESETLVLRAGVVVPVVRTVRRTVSSAGAGDWFVVTLRDRSAEVDRARCLERDTAFLRATLESTPDGLLVTDLAGRILHFNERFAAIWRLPEALTQRRDDDAVLDWMRRAVVDPAAYMRRLAELDDAVLAEATDRLRLQHGCVVERVTRPQTTQARAIGRVATFREITFPPPAASH